MTPIQQSVPVIRQHRNGTKMPAKRMRGLSLIEVLVSVLILGVGLLGIAAMQAMALRGGQSSLESTQAVMQTTGIIESMRANPAANYNIGKTCTAPAASTLVTNDQNNWITALQTNLGSAACGEISGCPGACVITIYWDDSRAGTAQGGTSRNMVTRAQI
ncbi:type IV pilus modification protein PilV [Thermomonas sp.]|uniref:type IV pilus modification protein PilV n=1 Tax=Thermomonas sp. TaxID=1971895 RepID=UPI00248A7C85|nr:type IV pilus modification protein PilV [Thermomonas sp.]MDI1252035.1 type IV pilus modification protein PilV [Thermomonas sp.]